MNITVGSGGKEISWDYNGKTISKSYSEILMGYEILPDNAGVLLLEPSSEVGPENAVIYDLVGSQRWRLPFPKDLGVGICFDRVGLSAGQLVVVGIVNGRDVKFEVDYNNLKYIDVAATR